MRYSQIVALKILATSCGARLRYGLAGLAGLLVSLGFAPANISGAAWIGPGLMLFCALGASPRRAFALGLTSGFVCSLCSLSWLLAMPFAWHGIPLAPALGWAALSAYCGVYTGVWVWFCWRIFPGSICEAGLSPAEAVERILSTPLWKRIGWALLCAAAWTALELMRGRFLGGFPWNFLGTSQYRMLPLIQMAAFTGVFGLSFLMVWFSVALGGAMISLARRPGTERIWGEMALPLLAVAAAMGFGMSRFAEKSGPARTLRVALVQPSIPQTLIFDPNGDAQRFQEVMDLSEKAMASKPDLLIWPESGVPDLTTDEQEAVGRMLEKHSAWLLFCEDSAESLADASTVYFNSAFLVSPKGMIEAIYHKRRLVIFGEYIPLVRWLPFLKWLTPVGTGFTPGQRVVSFDMTEPSAHLSPLICFEDSFADEAREHTAANTDFLVNLTNDGWFGKGAAQWQQAASAVFRAVENGLPMVRCANNGVTCWVDARGRLRQVEETGGNIYGPGFMTAEVPLQNGKEGRPTFYNQHGDVFAGVCGAASVCAGSVLFRKRGLSRGRGTVSPKQDI